MQFQENNIVSVVREIERKIGVWNNFPFSRADRIALIRSVSVPKLLYVLSASPIWIEDNIYKRIMTLLDSFLWRCKKGENEARIFVQKWRIGIPK